MIKILHAADLHLDSAFEALSDEKAALRRSEQRHLLQKTAELAEAEGVSLILLAGDLLDSDSPYSETSEMIAQAFSGLSARVFISPGNHDFWTSRSPFARMKLPENVHIFRSETIECVSIPELGVRVWGAGFTASSAPSLLTGFKAEKEDGLVDIMVVHGEVGAKSGSYNPITEDELALSGMDYVALGHIHTFSGLRRAGNTFYAWPGCPEGRGFDEPGEKGVILSDVARGECSLEFSPLDGRRYEVLEVDITNFSDVAAELSASIPAGSEKHIYRIILTGECDSAPDLGELRRLLTGRFFELQLRDRTVIRRDIWEKAGEDTLRGLFLTKLRRRYDTAESQEEREKIIQAVRWGLCALDGGEELYTL